MGIFHMFAIFILCWKGTCLLNHTSIQAGWGKHSDIPLEYGTEFPHSVLVNCVLWEDERCQSNAVSLCKNMSQDLIEIQSLSRQGW